jgi:hypothetical protein
MGRADGQTGKGWASKTKRGRWIGRCEWLAGVLLCNTMASEGYFSEGGTREYKPGADATGHVGEIMSQYLHILDGLCVVQAADKAGNS